MHSNVLKNIKTNIDAEELIALTSRLITIESHNKASGYEEEVANYINRVLIDNGIDSRLQLVEEHRYNVIGEIRGKNTNKTLMLTGHMDTVESYGHRELFTPVIKDNRIYGRGASDMKGPIASMISAAIALKKADIQPECNIVLAFVADEEFKSIGTEALIESGVRADTAILGEPTNMSISLGNRGLEWIDIEVIGRGTHGGTADKGINAVSKAAHLIERINTNLTPRISKRIDPLLGGSTMNFGCINGGYQPSTVPDRCVIQIDRRWIFGESVENIYREYQQIIDEIASEDKDFKATLRRNLFNMNKMEHGPVCIDKDEKVVKSIGKFLRLVSGITPKVNAFPGWTDASLLSNYGNTPTVIFGPGDIGCAHSERENIDIDELYNAAVIYACIMCDKELL